MLLAGKATRCLRKRYLGKKVLIALVTVLSFLHHGWEVWRRLYFRCRWILEVSFCVFLVTQTYFVFCLKLNGIGVVADYCSVNNVYVLMSHYTVE